MFADAETFGQVIAQNHICWLSQNKAVDCKLTALITAVNLLQCCSLHLGINCGSFYNRTILDDAALFLTLRKQQP